VRCSLAPLPRKGHTLNTIMIHQALHLVVFGGYSIENITLSNTLLVCDCKKIQEYYEISKKIQLKKKNNQIIKGYQKEYDLQSIVWRERKPF
jgi:hypothetical protein